MPRPRGFPVSPRTTNHARVLNVLNVAGVANSQVGAAYPVAGKLHEASAADLIKDILDAITPSTRII